MDDVAESLVLRCPNCGQGIVTIPKGGAIPSDLICPACGAETRAPSAIERMAADIEESLSQAIAALDDSSGKAGPPQRKDPSPRSDQ